MRTAIVATHELLPEGLCLETLSIGTGRVSIRVSSGHDNVLTIYGKDENSRVTDPDDPRRIFTWMICFAYLLEKFIADSSCPVSIRPSLEEREVEGRSLSSNMPASGR